MCQRPEGLEEAGTESRGAGVAPLTPCFWSCHTDLGLWGSGAVTEQLAAQQPQRTSADDVRSPGADAEMLRSRKTRRPEERRRGSQHRSHSVILPRDA